MALNAEQCRMWFEEQIKEIQKIQNKKHRLILLISLADAFAQSRVNYKQSSNRKCFSSFLIQYNSGEQNEGILRTVCPVTLYYDKKDEYQFGELSLRTSRIYPADSDEMLQEAKRLEQYIPEDKREYVLRHRYADLIYAMRNKLVHEMVDVGLDLNFQDNKTRQIPHVVHGNVENEGGSWSEYWGLHIPETFVFDVIEKSVNEYLSWCTSNKKVPFKNNLLSRKCYLAWYDR